MSPCSAPTLQSTAPKQLSLFVTQEAVSKAALLLFRDLVGLSKRAGYGFINTIHSLIRALGRDISERRLWQLIAELKAAGWIHWEYIREKGQRGLKFRPLVKLPKQTRGRFAPRAGAAPQQNLPVVQGPFSCPEIAPSVALSNGKSCTLKPSTPYKTSPVGTEDDNRHGAKNEMPAESPEQAVAVSILKEICSESEALEFARVATQAKRTPEQIKRVITAYRAQVDKIQNRGGWLRRALEKGYNPPAAPASHPSDSAGSALVYRIVKSPVPPPALPTVQPGRNLLDSQRDPKLLRITQRCSALAKAKG